jgi:hypothetical protein
MRNLNILTRIIKSFKVLRLETAWMPYLELRKAIMVVRKNIGDYELCLEISHTDDELLGETTIHHKEVYYHNGTKVKRSAVPRDVLLEFDKWADEQWWTYCDELDTDDNGALS